MISTGVSRSRVRPPFAAVVDEAVARLTNRDVTIDVYVYGSVATGTAVTGVSDVDLLTIGATPVDAAEVAQLHARAPRPRVSQWSRSPSPSTMMTSATPTRSTETGSSSATTASTSPAHE